MGNRSETHITVDSIIIPPAVTVANTAVTVVISSIDLYQNDVPAFQPPHLLVVVDPVFVIVQLRTDGSVYICRASHSPVNCCRCQGLIAFVVEGDANNRLSGIRACRKFTMLYHVFRPVACRVSLLPRHLGIILFVPSKTKSLRCLSWVVVDERLVNLGISCGDKAVIF